MEGKSLRPKHGTLGGRRGEKERGIFPTVKERGAVGVAKFKRGR